MMSSQLCRKICIFVSLLLTCLAALSGGQQGSGEATASEIQNSQQKIVQGPENTDVVLGDTAKLRCKVENQVGVVQWIRQGFSLGSDRALSNRERYSMVGSSTEGEYDLEIKDVQLSDENIYQCQILAMSGQPMQKSKSVKLTILVPPSEPLFSDPMVEKVIKGLEGHLLTSRCQVLGGKPHATVEWIISLDAHGQNVTRTLPQELPLEILTHNNLLDVESTIKSGQTPQQLAIPTFFPLKNFNRLRFNPEAEDDQKFLICAVKHPAIKNVMLVFKKLQIMTKPKITVSLNSSRDSLIENGFAVLSCERMPLVSDGSVEPSTSNRNADPPLRFQWYREGTSIESANDAMLHVTKLNKSDHHNKSFTCRAENDVGWTEAAYTISVKYAPYFKSSAQKFVKSVGESATFTCQADSNPPPLKYKWTKSGPTHGRKFETSGQNLTLSNLQYANEGKYVCEVITGLYAPVYQTNHLYLRGPPRVSIDNSPNAVKGGNAKIYCKISGYPKAPDNNATWYKGKTLLSPHSSHRFEISHSRPNQEEMYNVLLIKRVLPMDFDTYNCTVSNEFGLGFATVRLVEATDFPMYFMVPGVVGGCLAILFIAAAIVWANRKYLCHSKASVATTHSDDQSDLTIKMEDMGQRGVSLTYFPDVYSSGPTEASELMLNGRQTYFAVPQDNPDSEDLVLPPYHHHFSQLTYHQPASTNNRSASGSFNNICNGGCATPRGCGSNSSSGTPPLPCNGQPLLGHGTVLLSNGTSHPTTLMLTNSPYPTTADHSIGRFSYAPPPSMADYAVTVPTYASYPLVSCHGPTSRLSFANRPMLSNDALDVGQPINPGGSRPDTYGPTLMTSSKTCPPVPYGIDHAMTSSSFFPYNSADYTPHFSVANHKTTPAPYSTFGRFGGGATNGDYTLGGSAFFQPQQYHHPVTMTAAPFSYLTGNNNSCVLETVPEVATPDIMAEEVRVAGLFGRTTKAAALGAGCSVGNSMQRCDSQFSTHV